jgi:hypothetical protein
MKVTLQHIHLRSKNKLQLAQWYCANLGFKIIEDLESRGELGGPILITSDNGQTGLSIFTSEKEPNNIFPAFGTDPATFFNFHEKFSAPRIYDHYHFFSFYLKDLDQNKIEICCTEYQNIKDYVSMKKIEYFLMTPETYTP